MSLNEINITTERLFLRSVRLSDAGAIFSYRSKPEIYRFQNWRPQTLQEVQAYITENISGVPDVPDTWHQLGIFIKGTDVLIGDFGIHFIGPDNKQAEIGFTMSPACQGKGYAAEAAAGVVGYLLGKLGKHRIFASVDPENLKSIALLERLCMRKEAHFKKSYWFNGGWADDVVYAILEEEWQK